MNSGLKGQKATYRQTRDEGHLREILALQSKNLEQAISNEVLEKEGYVTVHHNLKLLQELAEPHGHTVALINGVVVGYALVMTREFADRIPVLKSMFKQFENCHWAGVKLGQIDLHVMGQICVDSSHRGSGLFRGLYDHQRTALKGASQVIITEVAERNQRSLQAHLAIGFESIQEFSDENELWHIIGLAT